MTHAELLRLLDTLPHFSDPSSRWLSPVDRLFVTQMRILVGAGQPISAEQEAELVRIAQGWENT